jgi:hypothetical protein
MESQAVHAAPNDPTPPPTGRDARGRFTRGNAGGPGNPFARRTAALRRAFCEAVSEEDMRQMVEVIKLKALGGDLAACKLLLGYCVGRPGPVVEPDTLDVEEFKQYERELGLFEKVPQVIGEFTPDILCEVVRTARPEIVAAKGRQLGDILRTGRMPGDPEPEEEAQQEQAVAAVVEPEPALSGIGDNGGSHAAAPGKSRPRDGQRGPGARRKTDPEGRHAGVTAPSPDGGNGHEPRAGHPGAAGKRSDPRPSRNRDIGGGGAGRRGGT